MKKLSFFAILVFYSSISFSQISIIKGQVKDAASGEPLPFCNVFVSNTTLGTTSDVDGFYQLVNIPQGEIEIGISYVGYTSQQKNITIAPGQTLVMDIAMEALRQQLSEVQIKSSRDKNWEKLQKRFIKLFLGTDRLAASCEITNPWIVDFPEGQDEKALLATANQPIEIRNRALGYYISFDLKEFVATSQYYRIVGPARFAEMETTDIALASVWTKNRRDVYLKSYTNLFKSMAEKSHNQAGFFLYTDKEGTGASTSYRGDIFANELGKSVVEYAPEKLVEKDEVSGNYRLYFPKRLEVHYQNAYSSINTYKDAPYPVSWIEVEGGIVHLSKDFVVLNPGDIVFSGDMDNKRVSSMLPLDYNPASQVSPKGKMSVADPTRLMETAYLHTDRNYYYIGDQVLFKAYMGYASPMLRDSLSKVLYIDLVSPDKKVVFTHKLRLENGMGFGDFTLPDTLNQTNYYLRAYTNWMRNYGDNSIFVKQLPVLDVKQRFVPTNKAPLQEVASPITVAIVPDKELFGKREKVMLDITLTDALGEPVSANFSVSITSTHFANPEFTETTIIDAIKPDTSRPVKDANLFRYKIEKNLSFSGIFFGDKKKPVSTKFQAFVDNFQGILDLETDKNGFFELSDMSFYGKMDVGLQAKDKSERSFGSFELFKSSPPFIQFEPRNIEKDIVNSGQPIYLSDFDLQSQVLDEVTISTARKVEYRDNVYGRPDHVIPGDVLNTTGSSNDLVMSLKNRVPGMTVSTVWDAFGGYREVIRIRGGGQSYLLTMEPLVIINGIPMTPRPDGGSAAENLRSINPADIDRVEVSSGLRSTVGDMGRNGIISVFLKNKMGTNFGTIAPKSPGMTNFPLEGFMVPSVVTNPDYERAVPESLPAFDQRPTLFWAPIMVTDSETGKAQIQFFTNDLSAPIYIVIEGVSTDGTPLRGTYMLEPDKRY